MAPDEAESLKGGNQVPLDDYDPDAVDADAYFDSVKFDSDEVDAAAKKLALPAGTYTTDGTMTVTASKDLSGRMVVQLWGLVSMVDQNGKDQSGFIGYRMSNEMRNGTKWVDGENTGEDSGKPDSPSKLYIQASKMYKAYHDDCAPDTPGELFRFMAGLSHRVRLMNTDDGRNIVVNLSAIR